jgi:hypothetical protein
MGLSARRAAATSQLRRGETSITKLDDARSLAEFGSTSATGTDRRSTVWPIQRRIQSVHLLNSRASPRSGASRRMGSEPRPQKDRACPRAVVADHIRAGGRAVVSKAATGVRVPCRRYSTSRTGISPSSWRCAHATAWTAVMAQFAIQCGARFPGSASREAPRVYPCQASPNWCQPCQPRQENTHQLKPALSLVDITAAAGFPFRPGSPQRRASHRASWGHQQRTLSSLA